AEGHRGRRHLVLQVDLPLPEALGGQPDELPVQVPDPFEQRLQVRDPSQVDLGHPMVEVRPDLLTAHHDELVVADWPGREMTVEDEMRQRPREGGSGVLGMDALETGFGATRAPFPGLERRSGY